MNKKAVAAQVTRLLDTSLYVKVFTDRHYRTLKRLDDLGAFGDVAIADLIRRFELKNKRGLKASVETFREEWKEVKARKTGEASARRRHAKSKEGYRRAFVCSSPGMEMVDETPAAFAQEEASSELRPVSRKAREAIIDLFAEHNASLPAVPSITLN